MHNHAPPGYACPLCAIARHSAPQDEMFVDSDLVYEGGGVLALVGAFQWPNNPGNVVVIPAAHYENLYDLPLEHACRIHDLTRGIALAMKAAWRCDGISTRQHNEPAGNQDVWHYHQHVTPRYEGDRLYATVLVGKRLMPPDLRARSLRRGAAAEHGRLVSGGRLTEAAPGPRRRAPCGRCSCPAAAGHPPRWRPLRR